MTPRAGNPKKSDLRARRVFDDMPRGIQDRVDGLVERVSGRGEDATNVALPTDAGVQASATSARKKLDGPLDAARFTLEAIDPRTLSESRRRTKLARFGLDPNLSEHAGTDRERRATDEQPTSSLQFSTRGDEN
jgi:hypothetical protein